MRVKRCQKVGVLKNLNPTVFEEQVRHARDLLTCPGNTVTSIAKLLGVSRNTLYTYMPELKGGRVAPAEATATAELPRPAKSSEWTSRLRLVTAFLPAPQLADARRTRRRPWWCWPGGRVPSCP